MSFLLCTKRERFRTLKTGAFGQPRGWGVVEVGIVHVTHVHPADSS